MEKFRFCLVAFRSRYGYRSFCAAAAQTHGPSRGWLPTIGPTFWSTLPFSSGPPQGGLLSSLNAGAANGLLGRLAAPVEHLESAHPGGIWAILSRSAAEPMGGSLPSLPRSPGWESLTTRLHLDSAEPYRQRQAGCLRTSAQIIPMPEGGPDPQTAKIMVETTVSRQPCRMSLPTTTGSRALTMRVKAITSSREHTTRECRRKPRKYLIKRGPDSSTSALIIGVMNMIGFTENTIRRPGSF
jgi:hypothetical protein